jgi:DNA polymerase-1
MSTLLIDGTNLAIIHFTANPAVDENGIPVGMVKGFLNAIAHLNRTLKPLKIIIFFDGKQNSSQRKAIFSEYKEGRKAKQVVGRFYKFSDADKAEKNKQYQFFALRELLELLPVNLIICNNFEADDGISYSVKYREFLNLGQVRIVSCDKDFYQLIDKDVSIYNPMSKKIIATDDVIKEFGIHPKNWLLYRSVAGDSSDNIDGVSGIGPKTLLKMFNLSTEDRFEIEDIEAACDEVQTNPDFAKEKVLLKNMAKVKDNIEKIKRNWQLMDLTNPMLTSLSREILDSAFQEPARFKKIDFYKKVTDYSIGINPQSFDDLKFLITQGKK